MAATSEHELAELKRELAELAKQAERLAGRARTLETVVERYGQDETEAPIGGKT